jgi:hypothetical protein
LDDVLLERQSLLQEAASSTLKVKRLEKDEKKREKLKQLLRERESVIGWINILHTYCSIYFLGLCLWGVVAYHCPHFSCPKGMTNALCWTHLGLGGPKLLLAEKTASSQQKTIVYGVKHGKKLAKREKEMSKSCKRDPIG